MTENIKTAVLVGVQLPQVSPEDFESSLLELTRLVSTLGYSVVGKVTQKRQSDRKASLLGRGKLKELAEWTGGKGEVASLVDRKLTKAALKRREEAIQKSEENLDEEEDPPSLIAKKDQGSAQIVIVDADLSPSQIRILESATGVSVLDRTGVIIEIFSRHARTRAARLQVEIARLTYLAPRLRETGGDEDRGAGGTGSKGSGETTIELDKRRIRDRIKELRHELESIGNEHEVRRARRENELCIALVGYTNAGKSSLMRALTGSEVLVADKLFATLDTTIRPMHPETKPKVLVSDTVGFIKKLPHDLVASFKSTLDAALHASLLLYVVDAADSSFRSQLEVTQSVLREVGATDVPSLVVLNKQDKLSETSRAALKAEFPEAILISTRDKDDIKILRDKIMSYFESDMIDEDIFVPYAVKGTVGEIRAKMRVLSESYDENGVHLRVRANPDKISKLKKSIQP